jgi:FkbM family methyltransferase
MSANDAIVSFIHRARGLEIAIKSLGGRGTIVYCTVLIREHLMSGTHSSVLISKRSRYPLWCRSGTSDLNVFHQIFIDREYSCLDGMIDVNLVVDCGAYVGYSSAYFLTRFPDCRLIAVEPDAGNFSVLKKNLARYKDRVRAMQAAVWSHPTGLVLARERYRDGREWTRQVKEWKGQVPDILGVDVATILAESGQSRISILKIDIEGAEAVVFGTNYEKWIDRVDAIVIELHNDTVFGQCSDIFFRAIQGRDFAISQSGELTVCRRRFTPRMAADKELP